MQGGLSQEDQHFMVIVSFTASVPPSVKCLEMWQDVEQGVDGPAPMSGSFNRLSHA